MTIRLTEVEAYAGVGNDPASHAHRGRTKRNAIMFGPAGIAYVYFTYGMHWCLNVVTGPEGIASGVLLRAGAVVAGTDLATERRGTNVAHRDLARGPARLAVALGIGGEAYGTSLIDGSGPVNLARRGPGELVIRSGPRVGVSAGDETPWRFWIDGDPSVSPYRKHVPRRAKRTGA